MVILLILDTACGINGKCTNGWSWSPASFCTCWKVI